MTHQTDDRAKQPGLLCAEHPDSINVEQLDGKGHDRFHERYIEGGRDKGGEVVYVPKARDEPVVHVRAIERRLYCFD